MPTTVTSSIGTSSRNYSTLQAWEDACPANLVTDDKIWRGECYNDSEFLTTGNNLLSMAGVTTDSTHYLELTAAPGQSFADHANKTTNALDYNQTYGVGIRTTGSYGNGAVLLNSYARLSRVQIKADAGNSYTLDCGGNNRITGCIIRNAASGQNKPSVFFSGSDHLINCLVISAAGMTVPGIPTLHNCTLVGGGGTAFKCDYGATVILTNTAVYNFTAMSSGSGGIASGSNYNSTDLAAPTNWGANSQASKTFANQFQNTTTDFRTKSTADLVGAGTRDQTYTSDLDIIGSARSITVPWIGAFEIAASGTTTVSNDLADSYLIRANVSGDLADSYALRSSISNDLADSYLLRAGASGDLADGYIVRAAVSNDLGDSYVLRNFVVGDYADTYLLRSSVASDIADSYALRSNVSNDYGDSYVIDSATSVGSGLADSYLIRSNVSGDLADSYALRANVSGDLEDAYLLRAGVAADFVDLYSLRNFVSSDYGDSYLSPGLVYSDLMDSYSLEGGATPDAIFTVLSERRIFTVASERRIFHS